MNTVFSTNLIQPSVILFGFLFIVAVFVLVFIPSLMVPGAKADKVAKAITCYFLKALGLCLVGVSGIQLLYAMITMQIPSLPLLFSLLLLFMVGLVIMLHMSRVLYQSVDEASESIIRLVFSHALEVMGIFISIISSLSIALRFILTQKLDQWEMPATMLLLGLVLAFTSSVWASARNGSVTKKGKRK